MTARRQPLWTIAELGAQVALALTVDYQGPPNGRVRSVPDQRTIRYYTTLGLLDRPAEMQGRTALYGRKHLLQLVAIKRLQARGLSLEEVQKHLLGLPEKKLQKIAQLPEHLEPHYVERNPEAKAPTARRDEAFWSIAAAPVLEKESHVEEEETLTSTSLEESGVASTAPLQGIGIAAGVTLLIAAERPIDDDDISALRASAAPVLKLLHQRRLIRPRATKGENHG